MSRFEFNLANTSDDSALRERMSKDFMEGAITISFRREPSYFIGSGVQGENCQIIKCIDKKMHQLAGLGARMTSEVFINGLSQRMGYLSDLRTAPEYRKGTLLARAYQYLQQLHQADPVPLYHSLILEGNHQAIKNITTSRAGLPIYRQMGKILTPAIHLDLQRKQITEPGITIQNADKSSLNQVFTFIKKQYKRHQFAPIYQAYDIAGARLYGIKAEDIYVASRQGKIIGVLAAWDQRKFRQTHVENYNTWLKTIRPAYNFATHFSSLKPLPSEGSEIPYFYLALTAIEKDDPTIFRVMLSHLYNERRLGEWHYFIAGLHEKHPLAKVLDEYRSIKAAGHLYIVHYPEDEAFFKQLDQRIPHIEMGAV